MAPQFQRLEQPTLVDRVYDDLRSAIITGELTPGTRISDARVATEMGVSRAPVREAIRRLASQGLVEEEPRRGVFVNGLSRASVRDVYECRRALEVAAARRVAAQADQTVARELRDILTQMQDAARRGDETELARLDHLFHGRISALAGNHWLNRLYDVIADQMLLILHVNNVAHPPADPDEMARIHVPIVEAVERGDPDAAAAAVLEHLDVAERLFLKEAAELLGHDSEDDRSHVLR